MLVFLEGIAILVSLILTIFWICDPTGNWEPWTLLFGLVVVVIEFKRRFKNGKLKSTLKLHDSVEIVRSEFSIWCNQVRSVLRHIGSHADIYDLDTFEIVLNQLRMNDNVKDEILNVPHDIVLLIRDNAPDFPALQRELGTINSLAEKASTQRKRRLEAFVALVNKSTSDLVDFKNPYYYNDTERNQQIANAIERLSEIKGRINTEAGSLSEYA